MSVLASYSFLPWVRLGLGNQISEPDFLGNAIPSNAAKERPDIDVEVDLKASKGDDSLVRPVSKTVKVQGPGDVLGINSQSIIRMHPKKGVRNFETNNLAYLEFYEEDLPWRFTPGRPNGNKLRPWFYLALLRENEFERGNGGTPTPFITIETDALDTVFCNEKDTYALAHVHVLEDLGNNQGDAATQLSAKLRNNPDLALSRILSPRKLEYTEPSPGLDYDPNVYHAFLIPAFETGRLAGLGLSTKDVIAQKSSWSRADINSGDNPNTYPFYHTWSFRVDSGGDFETLAELLEARELPKDIGRREMDLKNMGYGIQPKEKEDFIAYVEGAMKHPDYVTAKWPRTILELKEELRDVLNLSFNLQDTQTTFNDAFFYSPAADDDPIIVPPTYGKWHKGILSLRKNSQDWVHKINLHPGNRAAAGLGVRVIQEHQEKFMEIAWEQIGDINEANQKIRESELIKRATKSLAVKKVFKLDQFDLVNATGKAFDVLKFDPKQTIKKVIKSSTVPTAVRSGGFRKVANNFTPKRKLKSNSTPSKSLVLNATFFGKLNTNDSFSKISASPKRKEPSYILPTLTALAAIQSVVLNPEKSFMERLTDAILEVNKLNFTTNQVLNKFQHPANMDAPKKTAEDQRVKDILQGCVVQNSTEFRFEITVVAERFENSIQSNYTSASYGQGNKNSKILFLKAEASDDANIFDHAQVLQIQQEYLTSFETKFVTGIGNELKANLVVRPIRAILPIDLKDTIKQRLNPVLNFNRKLSSLFAKHHANNNKPIMAYPRFPIPMYDYLREISPDYIIPNVSEIEPNTITLMETNTQFIESFMVGLNHEFSRELLWREFPTDMRGSYFRHFWEYDNDPSAEKKPGESMEKYVDRIVDEQNIKADIKEIHNWDGPLGHNEFKAGPSLVLLVKGDLLRKYPNTLVYAQKAAYDGNRNKERKLKKEGEVKWPVITGKLEPDVYFFGFELTEDDANGNRVGEPGWFFVLRERPGQVSFGLDDLSGSFDLTPENWDDITWEHVTGIPTSQPPYLKINGVNINLSATGNGPRAAQWGGSSSDMAYILYQSPILFARHASTMLK